MPSGPTHPTPRLTRRRLLQLGLALPLPMALAACDDGPTGERAARPPTAASRPPPPGGARGPPAPPPACDEGEEPTLAQTEGPYFTPNSPERASLLEAGMGGQRLVVAG